MKSILFFPYCFIHFILLEHCVCAFLTFQMGFRQQEVFACIYTFPIDIVLMEFAEQHINRLTEVVWKLLSSRFRVWAGEFVK